MGHDWQVADRGYGLFSTLKRRATVCNCAVVFSVISISAVFFTLFLAVQLLTNGCHAIKGRTKFIFLLNVLLCTMMK
jgi:hypothetical protein